MISYQLVIPRMTGGELSDLDKCERIGFLNIFRDDPERCFQILKENGTVSNYVIKEASKIIKNNQDTKHEIRQEVFLYMKFLYNAAGIYTIDAHGGAFNRDIPQFSTNNFHIITLSSLDSTLSEGICEILNAYPSMLFDLAYNGKRFSFKDLFEKNNVIESNFKLNLPAFYKRYKNNFDKLDLEIKHHYPGQLVNNLDMEFSGTYLPQPPIEVNNIEKGNDIYKIDFNLNIQNHIFEKFMVYHDLLILKGIKIKIKCKIKYITGKNTKNIFINIPYEELLIQKLNKEYESLREAIKTRNTDKINCLTNHINILIESKLHNIIIREQINKITKDIDLQLTESKIVFTIKPAEKSVMLTDILPYFNSGVFPFTPLNRDNKYKCSFPRVSNTGFDNNTIFSKKEFLNYIEKAGIKILSEFNPLKIDLRSLVTAMEMYSSVKRGILAVVTCRPNNGIVKQAEFARQTSAETVTQVGSIGDFFGEENKPKVMISEPKMRELLSADIDQNDIEYCPYTSLYKKFEKIIPGLIRKCITLYILNQLCESMGYERIYINYINNLIKNNNNFLKRHHIDPEVIVKQRITEITDEIKSIKEKRNRINEANLIENLKEVNTVHLDYMRVYMENEEGNSYKLNPYQHKPI